MAVFQKQAGNAHIENRVRKAVVACDEYEHLFVRRQSFEQSFTLLLDGGSVFAYSHGAGHERWQQTWFGNAEHLAEREHGAGHGFLAKVQIKDRAQQRDSAFFQL